ncbi:MAG: hypothetical protein JW807_09310 [Spirochaetes bacterium]|nr:hypothetical protein [Spirochaetota bacterium]
MAEKKKSTAAGHCRQEPPPPAVLLFIVYSNAVDEEITEIVKKHAGGYTKFSGVFGEGNREPHLGSHIWPSMNNCMMVATNARQKCDLADEVLYLKEKFPGVGISVFITKLDELM